MYDLLPFYERELGFLRRYSRDFARRYPKVAGRLLLAGEVSEDPHIERMIQSFALLTARVSKRLDDDYPEFTEALFEVLYPHYLRPFPSCSIAYLDYSTTAAQLTKAVQIPRGTELVTRSVKGVSCKFRTSYDVTVAPISLMEARFDPIISAPESVALPPNATSKLSITLGVTSEQTHFAQMGLKAVRVFIDGETSFSSAFRDALFTKTVAAYVATPRVAKWEALGEVPLREVGFREEESLIDFPARAHPAYRLLTEYFNFPEKFNFFDIDLTRIVPRLPPGCRAFTLHIVYSQLRADSHVSRMLSTTSVDSLRLGCTPVVNLFKQRGDPIRLTHRGAHYPVVADSRRAFAYEIQSIDSVKMIRQTPQGDDITEFRPFYALMHSEMPEDKGHYWVARRDDDVADKSPGYETEISIVDIDFDPAATEIDTLSIELTCSNRDLPTMLTYGAPGGDLFLEGGSAVRTISFLRKPSESFRFARGRGAHWRLISQLSLNHLSLTEGGLEALRETLTLYDLSHSAASQRQINGVVAVDHRATTAWLPGNPFASLVRGTEVRMTVDEEAFVGTGLHLFSSVMDHFLGLYVHANSFTQLVIVSKRTGEELLRCLPRSGDLKLV